MRRRLSTLAVLALTMGAGLSHAQTDGPQQRGRRLAQTYCGQCHALGGGPSPMPDAPPFAQLHRRYPPGGGLGDLLGEGMIAPAVPQEEGVSTRHPRMPQVRLDEDQVSDLVVFLQSAQGPSRRRP